MTTCASIRKIARIGATGLTFLAILTAQQVPPSANLESPQPGTIEGNVNELSDGTPIPDVTVVVSWRGPSMSSRTDANGHYRITGVEPGSYGVFPRKEGYGRGMSASARRIRVAAGQNVSGVNFRLQREATVAGRVLDAKLEPVDGQRVTVWSPGYRFGRRTYNLLGSASTNDIGEFRIAGLREGRYYLAAVPPMLHIRRPSPRPVTSQQTAALRSSAIEVRTFYMSAASPEGASPLVLHAGEQRDGADIVLAREDTYCVAGNVDQAGSDPIVLTLMELSVGWTSAIAGGSVANGEDFEICGMPAGSYNLMAVTSTPEGEAVRLAQVNFVISNRNVALGAIPLLSPSEIAGQLDIAGTESIPPSPETAHIRLEPVGRYAFLNEAPEIAVGRAGSFLLRGVFTGEYWVTFRLPSGFYVKQANCGTIDALREPILAGCGHIHVVLGTDGAVVSGRVIEESGGMAIGGATVVLFPSPFPDAVGPDTSRTIETDQNGEFEFGNVAPGKYRLLAFRDLRNRETDDPDFVRRNQSKSEEIRVDRKEEKSITLKPSSVD